MKLIKLKQSPFSSTPTPDIIPNFHQNWIENEAIKLVILTTEVVRESRIFEFVKNKSCLV